MKPADIVRGSLVSNVNKRPNILFLFSDQQRWDTVGCYGQPLGAQLNLTPNLDRMAAEGVRFAHAFTCQPLCGPARSCLQSGVYATATGCYDNLRACLPPDGRYMAHELNDGGYETAYIGKWHLAAGKTLAGRQRYAVPQEYRAGYRDHWLACDLLEFTSHGYEGYLYDADNRRVDFEGYRVDCMANFVIDYLRDYAVRQSEKPFFLMASFIEPHQQNDLDRYVGPIGSKQRFADYPVPGDLVGTTPQPGALCDWPLHMPDYLGCCWSLDQNVGRIRETLRTLGLADDTLVIYSSDHGSHFRTRNSEYKRSCHEASIHVPLIAVGPGFSGGKVIDDLVSLIDLPPTILAAAGVAAPQHYHGRAMQPLLTGDTNGWQDDVFMQISESQVGRAVRTNRWKYCVTAPGLDSNQHSASDRYVEQYLYDLDADPHERDNRVADPAWASVRAELAGRLKKRMVLAGESEPSIEPAE